MVTREENELITRVEGDARMAAYEKGILPPGSARGSAVRIPDPYDAMQGPDESWRDLMSNP